MEGSCASYLPPELWQMIFHGFDHERELAHLWTWGRLVSWQFRNNIELVFATKWPQETVINFDLGKPGSLVEDRPHCAPTLITVHSRPPEGPSRHNMYISIQVLRGGSVLGKGHLEA